MNTTPSNPIVCIRDLSTKFGSHCIHEHLDLDIQAGDVMGIIGGSGCGKTTLMRNILMLTPYSAGNIEVFGQNLATLSNKNAQHIRRRWGVMFQQGALFSGLTVWENIAFPLQEFLQLPKSMVREIAFMKMEMVGLAINSAYSYPSELSGGMLKRVAVARAIAMDPELLFLDEPTAGLDPYSSHNLDELIVQLHHHLGLTVVIITHDIDTLWMITNKVAFLGEKKVLTVAPMATLVKNSHSLIQDYFSRPRTRATVE